MMSQAHQLLVMALAIAMITTPVKCTPSRVLDETGASPPAPEIKCTMCTSCQNSCNQSPPPPPPSPPPAPKKPKPSTPYCPPPPPPPNFIIIGPPGDLYPVDPHHFPSGASRISGTCMPMLLGCGLIALVGFWRL